MMHKLEVKPTGCVQNLAKLSFGCY